MPNIETFKHQQPGSAFDARGSAAARGSGSDWRKLRRWYLARHPLCEHCLTRGITKPAQDVDHKQPFAGKRDRLRLDPNNLQALCRACHNVKTRNGNLLRQASPRP